MEIIVAIIIIALFILSIRVWVISRIISGILQAVRIILLSVAFESELDSEILNLMGILSFLNLLYFWGTYFFEDTREIITDFWEETFSGAGFGGGSYYYEDREVGDSPIINFIKHTVVCLIIAYIVFLVFDNFNGSSKLYITFLVISALGIICDILGLIGFIRR